MRNLLAVIVLNLLFTQATTGVTCGTVVSVPATPVCNGDSTGSLFFNSPGPNPYWLTIAGTTSQYINSQTLTGLAAGNYFYQVIDSVSGCSDTGSIIISEPPPLFAMTTTNPPLCANAFGWAALTVNGGTPPYSYLWSNGSTTPVQQMLFPGVYQVFITDANGCTTTVSINIVQLPPIAITFSVTPPSCNTCPDGLIQSNVTGGNAPYLYQWGPPPTTSTQSVLNGVLPGIYQLCVTDGNGCQTCDSVLCLGPGYQYVSGLVYYDYNGNGTRDSGEAAASNQHVFLMPDSLQALSGPSGAYGFFLSNGSYTDSLVIPVGWHTTTPAVYPLNLTGSNVSGLDFGLFPDNPDAGWALGYLFPPAPRCLSQRSYTLRIQNTGWGAASGIAALTLDPQMTLINTSPIADSVVGTTYYWHFDSLLSGTGSYRNVTVLLPAAGSVLQMSYRVWTYDSSGTLNVTDSAGLVQTVTCSYDPNDKAVNPPGFRPDPNTFIPELVEMDTPLEYTIRFQNTGNDTAYVVVIRDTIDSDLDLSTVEILGASHQVNVNLDTARELAFTFDHIMLPDSNVDEPGSHGFVQYRIRPLPGLPYNTYVHNTAHIYFDFNPAVVTNTTVSRYDVYTGLSETHSREYGLLIYPHPILNEATVSFDRVPAEGFRVWVTDLLGRECQSIGLVRSDSFRLDASALPAGIYLLRVQDVSTGTLSNRKLVIR